MKFDVVFFHLLGFLLLVGAGAVCGAGETPPNFVVIFIDDMGYGDLRSFYEDAVATTPHLDRMAEEGMKLTSFYAAAAVCTPSRAALLTGSYPRRVGMGRGWKHAVLFPGDPIGLHSGEITVADVLREAGYATGCFGKWHLGDQPAFLPDRQGFDVYYGIPYSNDMWPPHPRGWDFPPLPIMRDTEVVGVVDDMDDQAELAKQFTDAAIGFIRANRDRPFFAYVPHAFVHRPRQARPRFMEQADGDETLAQVLEVDYRTGQILDVLRELDIAEHTLVIFTSDNGPALGLSSGPLRGGKGSLWEGGFRVPALAWWPGTIAAGSASDEIATAMDLLPTFARLAGARVPDDRVLDGKDIAPLLLGEEGATTPHERFFYEVQAVRSGPWKLLHGKQLYNLNKDIGEQDNVAEDHPGVVRRLRGYLRDFRAELQQNSRPAGRIGESEARTILPRPGREDAEAHAPTHNLPRR